MRFLVHYEGAGEGCDYTIGCNHAISSMEAGGVGEAIKKIVACLVDYPEGLNSNYDPERIKAITVYPLAEPDIADTMSLDLETICIRRQAKLNAAAAKTRDAEDRALYETLKSRYE